MKYTLEEFDVAVVGGGHAGIEAALAAARLGCKTVLFTISLDAIANLPCNPSIGGTAKGHLVREIDALGGEMAKAADETFLQSRILNLGKGPAVHSLRVQADRRRYHDCMKHKLELTENLSVKQSEIVELVTDEEKTQVRGVVTRLGAFYPAKAVIIATGTYLSGKIFVGDVSYAGGPDGVLPSVGLSDSLRAAGIELRRFKTGTPARVKRSSIDFSELESQEGDNPVTPFSFETTKELHNRVVCHVTYTNEKTHEVIRQNLHRSPLYSGLIEGVGPRYCPSIEDKVVRFADKPRHQLFIEPMGEDTEEMYLQGMSSSLPEDVQIAMYRTIKGLEHVEIMRNAYAIEYDCCNPLDLFPTLESKKLAGLYGAGQFNGTSGYEEAAAQGLIAGINAARRLKGKSPVILTRDSSYIGTLIDDLTTKGCNDPYRMMTSRSEYRLILRQDNADERLTPLGHEIGLISDERYADYLEKQRLIAEETARVEEVSVTAGEELNRLLAERATAPLKGGCKLADLLRRPQITYDDLAPFDPTRPPLPRAVTEQVQIRIKYAGYIDKQERQVAQMKKWETRLLPPDLDYKTVPGLRLEAQEKLNRVKPLNVGQAARISGVNPADINVLMIRLSGGHHE